MKILAIDDSHTMLALIKKTLTEMGYTDFELCDSAESALTLLEKQTFQVILLDWHMPGYSGLDFLRIIKNRDTTKYIPVIMLTVEEHPKSIDEAFASGVDGYLVKPINPEMFKALISHITEKKTE
jgi:two-component system chemotaxis response regulator CheY